MYCFLNWMRNGELKVIGWYLLLSMHKMRVVQNDNCFYALLLFQAFSRRGPVLLSSLHLCTSNSTSLCDIRFDWSSIENSCKELNVSMIMLKCVLDDDDLESKRTWISIRSL